MKNTQQHATSEQIAALRRRIEILPAAAVQLPDDLEEPLVGNEAGYIELAITALRASQGEYQSLEQPWVMGKERNVSGFLFDADAAVQSLATRSLTLKIKDHLLLLLVLIIVFCRGVLAGSYAFGGSGIA